MVIEGSVTGAEARDAELLGLSARAALVRTAADVEPLCQLAHRTAPGSEQGASRYLFAKVLSREAGEKTFVARFTAVDPEAARLLEDISRSLS